MTVVRRTEGEKVTRRSATNQIEDRIIIAEGLTKHFMHHGETVRAVDGVSFTLSSRQLVAVTGPSGCGKSTLLYLLGALEKPTAGKLVISGVDIVALSGRRENAFRRNKVGFVFQSFHLIPNLSALENVMLPMELAGRSRQDQAKRARGLLAQVGIGPDRWSHRPGKLSAGQQQRVAIARSLANDPPVILADEPTGNLDSHTSEHIVKLLLRLAYEGRTVVLVTHDKDIARHADTHLSLHDGRVSPANGVELR
jgi:ABC-type lipoprotein export system ATPase subunit